MYTCFAPNNAAIERFLVEQDSIYWASVAKHESNPELFKIVDTGIYSPKLEDLSDEKCGEIARNHILPKVYYGTDFTGNGIPDANMNERDLTLSVSDDGFFRINSEAKV